MLGPTHSSWNSHPHHNLWYNRIVPGNKQEQAVDTAITLSGRGLTQRPHTVLLFPWHSGKGKNLGNQIRGCQRLGVVGWDRGKYLGWWKCSTGWLCCWLREHVSQNPSDCTPKMVNVIVCQFSLKKPWILKTVKTTLWWHFFLTRLAKNLKIL